VNVHVELCASIWEMAMERYQKQQEMAVTPVWNLSNHGF